MLFGDLVSHSYNITFSMFLYLVQSVVADPEPMCVLATDQQLFDLERFCCGTPLLVLSIDPTFIGQD